MLDPQTLARLNERLDGSRAALLRALEGVTERDFSTDLGGETVVGLLARLADGERRAVATARGRPAAKAARRERPLPPQVVHDLAGARHQTRRYLEEGDTEPSVAERLVEALERAEAEAASRIRARPAAPPPPDIPVISPHARA